MQSLFNFSPSESLAVLRALKTVAIGIALVVLLALFSLFSRGLAWLLIMVVLMVAAILLLRPVAHDWFVDR